MGRRLYVGNLPYSISEEEIVNHFSQLGTVVSVSLVIDRQSGRPKGFCFLEMSTDEESAAAIDQMNGAKLGERILTVSEARPREGGGRGGFDRGPRN